MIDKDIIEEKRNEVNLNLRLALSVIDFIDNNKREYEDYITDSLDELGFLEQQNKLALEIKDRLRKIFE